MSFNFRGLLSEECRVPFDWLPVLSMVGRSFRVSPKGTCWLVTLWEWHTDCLNEVPVGPDSVNSTGPSDIDGGGGGGGGGGMVGAGIV